MRAVVPRVSLATAPARKALREKRRERRSRSPGTRMAARLEETRTEISSYPDRRPSLGVPRESRARARPVGAESASPHAPARRSGYYFAEGKRGKWQS